MGAWDSEAIRKEFPILDRQQHGNPLIYLDNAATAHKPRCVIEGESHFYAERYGTVHRAVYGLAAQATEAYQSVRASAASFLNAPSSEEIVFTRGSTESMNLLAHCCSLAFMQPGDEIILSELEHHSNIVPWQLVSELRDLKIRVIPILDNGQLDLEAYANLLNERTRVVSIGHISNALGTLHPIKQMVEMAHAVGAKFVCDGAQGAPCLAVDVQDLGVDFYVFSGHKVYGPTGVGVLWGRMDYLDAFPPYQGGGSMIERVSFESTTFDVVPQKFEAGTPMIAQVIGLGCALDYLSNLGMAQVWEHGQDLLQGFLPQLRDIPELRIFGHEGPSSALVSFLIEGIHPLDIASFLDFRGIAIRSGHHCAMPLMQRLGVEGTLRASIGIYNTAEELEIFCRQLREVIAQLRG